MVLTFESVDEFLKCDRSNESCGILLFCGTVHCALQVVLSFESMTMQIKSTAQYFRVALFIMLYKVVLTFESVDEILKCDHSNESYRAVLSCGAVYYAVKLVLTFRSL